MTRTCRARTLRSRATAEAEGIEVVEAPRGALFHHYRFNENDQVVIANLIVATTHNNEPMNRAVEQTARECLSGVTITEGLLNRVEVAIRAYEPCLSCATHAVGRMPLMVNLLDHEGNLLDRKMSAGEEHGFEAGFSSALAR